MKQYDAINIVTAAIIKDELVEACFLKGSIARKQEDLYSDIDLYCIVKAENKQMFLNKRIIYLETYLPILHSEEVNFVGPQIVCIYENGLHFDLYTITLDELQSSDHIQIIYDPQDLLKDYQPQDLSLKDHEIGEAVNRFSYTLLELYSACKRKDHIWGFRLAHHLFGDYTLILRSFKDPSFSKLGTKGFIKNLQAQDLHKYIYNAKLIKYDSYLLGVKTLIVSLHEVIINLPIKVAESVNFDFFIYSKKLIFSLDEEKL